MGIKQRKIIVLTEDKRVWCHGGFKPLDEFKKNVSRASMCFFDSISNAKKRMNDLFDDATPFDYVEVEVSVVECTNEKSA